jgi:hypothetical protein
MPRKKIARKRKNSKVTGQDFENFVQKTINSGTLKIDPLDLTNGDYCIECKTVKDKQKSYRITLETLEKTWSKSLDMGKQPAMIIGIPRNEHEIFILRCEVSVEKRRGI